jgi:hypothetical protein
VLPSNGVKNIKSLPEPVFVAENLIQISPKENRKEKKGFLGYFWQFGK